MKHIKEQEEFNAEEFYKEFPSRLSSKDPEIFYADFNPYKPTDNIMILSNG